MDNVHAHYVRSNTRVIERGPDDSWLMYADHAVFVFNSITAEHDFLGYSTPPRGRQDETRLRMIKEAMSCSA